MSHLLITIRLDIRESLIKQGFSANEDGIYEGSYLDEPVEVDLRVRPNYRPAVTVYLDTEGASLRYTIYTEGQQDMEGQGLHTKIQVLRTLLNLIITHQASTKWDAVSLQTEIRHDSN